MPFRRWMKLPEVVLAERGVNSGIPVGDGERKVDPEGVAGWAEPGAVTHLAVVRWDPSQPMSREELGAPDALRHLLDAVLPTGRGGEAAFHELAPMVEGAESCFLTYSDCHRAAERLEEWMERT